VFGDLVVFLKSVTGGYCVVGADHILVSILDLCCLITEKDDVIDYIRDQVMF